MRIQRILKPALIVAERVWLPFEQARLRARGEHRLARALSVSPNKLCDAIERCRAEMSRDRSPLVDGSLGPSPMPFDKGTIAEACSHSKAVHAARALYGLVAEYRPDTIIELGTNVGISSAYLAAAGGKVTTLDASPYRQGVAKRLHHSLGLDIDYVLGLFTDTLDGTLDRIAPVQMAFIDGHHQYQPTLDYFEAIAAKASPGCVFIFDDIRWSSGMRQAWSELRRDSRFDAVADLGGVGIGVLRGPREA